MELEASRVTLITAVERTGMIGRYTAYFILAPMFLFGYIEGTFGDFLAVTGIVLAHNLFSHYVLLTGRVKWFLSPVNLLVYLTEACLVVYFSGAEKSTGFLLFLLIIIGYSAYARRFWRVVGITVLCCLLYLLVILVEWRQAGLAESPGFIVSILVFMGLSGWLVGRMSEALWQVEERYFTQAQERASSEATLRTILNNAPDPILVYDEEEFITEANEHACSFLGMPREELMGRRMRVFLFDDGSLPAKISILRARGEARSEEILVDAEGGEHHVDLTIRSFQRDERRYFVAIARDISEQKALQEATRLANTHLERLNNELRQVDALRTGFLATVSQRVRSPLSAALGYLELLIGQELGEITTAQQRALQTSRRCVLRVLRVMDEALELAGQRPAPATGKNGPEEAPVGAGSPEK
jgi:PAS domain S-box-containing protein